MRPRFRSAIFSAAVVLLAQFQNGGRRARRESLLHCANFRLYGFRDLITVLPVYIGISFGVSVVLRVLVWIKREQGILFLV